MRNPDRPTEIAVLPSGPVEYRLERGSGPVVLIFHGGHMRAGLALGEETFTGAGHPVLVPSRPGYGRTPLSAGPSPAEFTDVVRVLCGRLGIARIAAVVGVSGGGPTAVAMAARHPDLVERLVLISAVGPRPWPGRLTRLGAYLAFGPAAEARTWAVVRRLVDRPGRWPLQLMLGSVSVLPARQVVAALTGAEQETLRAMFASMRSGRRFRNDLRPGPDLSPAVGRPTLVVASRQDGGVPFAHAEALVAGIPHATLVESRAAGHFVWFAPDWPAVTERIRCFLTSPAGATTISGPPPGRPRPAPPPPFHPPLRRATAALAGAGGLLAAGTAVPAYSGLGWWSAMTFAAVALAGGALAAALLQGARWAVGTAMAGLAGQPIIAVAALWQLYAGMPGSKADQLRRLGARPTFGAAVELAYSTLGVALLAWLIIRRRRRSRGT